MHVHTTSTTNGSDGNIACGDIGVHSIDLLPRLWLLHFRKVRTLGESDDEDGGALAWIKKSRKLQRDKEEAEKRVTHDYLNELNPVVFSF